MPGRYATNGNVVGATLRAGWRAWVGRAMLALVPVVVLGATGLHLLQQREEQLQERAGEQMRWFAGEYGRGPLSQETRRAIDEGVEEVFAPVYDEGIPKLLDRHYSAFGQYTELVGLVLPAIVQEQVESRLFAGLEERIDEAVNRVSSVMQEELLAELDQWFAGDVASIRPRLRPDYERILEPMLADARRRFTVSIGPTALSAAMAGVGTSLGVNALAAALAGRLSSGVGSAAVRAAGGSLSSTVTLGAGIAVWLGVDYLARRVGEWWGREDLEQELTALVDNERERFRSALTSGAEEVRARPLCPFIPSELRGGHLGQPVLSDCSPGDPNVFVGDDTPPPNAMANLGGIPSMSDMESMQARNDSLSALPPIPRPARPTPINRIRGATGDAMEAIRSMSRDAIEGMQETGGQIQELIDRLGAGFRRLWEGETAPAADTIPG